MGNLVQYGSYTLDAAEQEEQDLAASGGGAEFMKLKEGKNLVRFMPPALGVETPFQVVSQHYIKNPTGNAVVFACPRVMQKRFCPACQKANQFKATGNSADKKAAMELFPRRRIFANVIDRTDQEAGPKILAFGKTIQESLVKIRKNEDIGGDFTCPKEGFDIQIERSGQGLNTSYHVLPARRESPLGNMEWIAMQHDLSRYAIVPDDEDLGEMLAGIGTGGGGGGGGQRQTRRQAQAQRQAANTASAFDDATNVEDASDDVSW